MYTNAPPPDDTPSTSAGSSPPERAPAFDAPRDTGQDHPRHTMTHDTDDLLRFDDDGEVQLQAQVQQQPDHEEQQAEELAVTTARR